MRWSDDLSSCSSSVELRKDKAPLNKSVRFNDDQNQVFPIQHLDDIPEDEVQATWYDSNEYSEIKQSYQLTIFLMESGETLKNDEHSSRGLEYRTQEGAWARYENKRDAYNAVLDEQDRQWQRDQDDHDEIARIYIAHSSKCAEAALKRGLDDEKVARDILRSIIPPRRLKKKKPIDGARKPRRRPAGEGMDKAQELLRERSSIRRSEIRDDIKQLQKKQTTKSSPNSRSNRTISV